jgi:hypothetical protein
MPKLRARPDVQFLQRHHIRPGAGDDAGDAFGIELAVHADAAVHVVGHDAQDVGRAWWRCVCGRQRACRAPRCAAPLAQVERGAGSHVRAPPAARPRAAARSRGFLPARRRRARRSPWQSSAAARRRASPADEVAGIRMFAERTRSSPIESRNGCCAPNSPALSCGKRNSPASVRAHSVPGAATLSTAEPCGCSPVRGR